MKKKNVNLLKILHYSCDMLENVVAVVVIIAVLITLVEVLYAAFMMPGDLFHPGIHTYFDFLANSLQLVIGLEFVHMLLMHRPEAVIDILMFATARKIITDHSLSMTDYTLGILAVALLFFLRQVYPQCGLPTLLKISGRSAPAAADSANPDQSADADSLAADESTRAAATRSVITGVSADPAAEESPET